MYLILEQCPVDAAGPRIAPSALEHSRNTSTPLELATMASLTCAAAVAQDIADVQRPDLPPSPTSVLCIGVAESGEGKSTAAKPFLRALERAQEKLEQRTEERHKLDAKLLVWKETLAHLRAELRRQLKEGNPDKTAESDIAVHLRDRPQEPLHPKFLYDNVTATALRRGLAVWPSALVVSMDGGHILNGSIGRDNDLLNSGYDGDTMRSDTMDDSSTAYAPRVSALILTQPRPALRYLARRGEEAHGTGLFARTDWLFLQSTKGTRSINPGPKSSDAIEAYQTRASDLLEERIRSRKAGDSSRRVIGFSPSGKAFFHDLYARVLPMSAPGGAFHGLGGYAAKIPERVARYACVIHVFNDLPGLIGAETLYHAELIVQWYTRQFLNMLTLASPQTQAMHDGQWLEQSLWDAARRGEMIRPADLARVCPFDWGRPRRNRALHVLCNSGRVRIERWKHVQYVQLSSLPQLSISLGNQERRQKKLDMPTL